MKSLKILFPMALLILVIVAVTVSTYAAELKPAQDRPLQKPISLQKLSQPPICPTLINSLENIIKIAHKDMQKTLHKYAETQNYITFPGIWELYYTGDRYREYVKGCCSEGKSFSIQDQKSAGCKDSDTVKQCTDKLVKYCIGSFKNKAVLREKLGHSQEKAKELSVETTQLAEELNKAIGLMQ